MRQVSLAGLLRRSLAAWRSQVHEAWCRRAFEEVAGAAFLPRDLRGVCREVQRYGAAFHQAAVRRPFGEHGRTRAPNLEDRQGGGGAGAKHTS